VIVEDNGPGIPEDIQRKIFDPFFTTKNPGEGTGLGLSIVRGIIDRIDGKIDIESDNGEGTRFIIKIPYSRDDHSSPETVSER
jgi:signal transduction histidine kinase